MALRSLPKLCCLFVLACLTTSAVGQVMQRHMSNSGIQIMQTNQTAACIYPYGSNCWSSLTASFAVVTTSGQSSSAGPHTFGLDSNGCVSLYSDPLVKGNNTWAAQAQYGCGLSYLQYAGDGNLYALSGVCGSGHYVVRWNGSSWVPLGGCYKVLSMAQASGGLAEGIDPSGTLWESTNYAVSFTQIGGCGGSGGAISVVVLTAYQIAVACGNTTIWWGAPNGSNYTQLPGATNSMLSGNGNKVWSIGTDGKVHRWILDDGYSSWDDLVSSFSSVSWIGYDAFTQSIWATSGGTAHRQTEWGLTAFRTLYASTVCQGGPCPTQHSSPPVFHEATTHIRWKINGVVVANGNAADTGHIDPATNVNLTSTAPLFDVPLCLAETGFCEAENDYETYNCSVEGPMSDGGGTSSAVFETEDAHTRVISGGNARCVSSGGFENCNYNVAPNCSNTLTPDLEPSAVAVSYPNYEGTLPYFEAFDVHSLCTSIGHAPWTCLGEPTIDWSEIDNAYTYNPGPAECTNVTP